MFAGLFFLAFSEKIKKKKSRKSRDLVFKSERN